MMKDWKQLSFICLISIMVVTMLNFLVLFFNIRYSQIDFMLIKGIIYVFVISSPFVIIILPIVGMILALLAEKSKEKYLLFVLHIVSFCTISFFAFIIIMSRHFSFVPFAP